MVAATLAFATSTTVMSSDHSFETYAYGCAATLAARTQEASTDHAARLHKVPSLRFFILFILMRPLAAAAPRRRASPGSPRRRSPARQSHPLPYPDAHARCR